MSACRNAAGPGVWPAVFCVAAAAFAALVTALACRPSARGRASAVAVVRAWWWYVIAGDLQRSCGLRPEPALVTYRGPAQRPRVTGYRVPLSGGPPEARRFLPRARTGSWRTSRVLTAPAPADARTRQGLARIRRAPAEPDHLGRAAPRRITALLADTLANPSRSRAHPCRKARARPARVHGPGAPPLTERAHRAPRAVAALRAAGNREGGRRGGRDHGQAQQRQGRRLEERW